MQSHILQNICTFPYVLGSPSSYMTLQSLYLNGLIYEENLIFFLSVMHVKETTLGARNLPQRCQRRDKDKKYICVKKYLQYNSNEETENWRYNDNTHV